MPKLDPFSLKLFVSSLSLFDIFLKREREREEEMEEKVLVGCAEGARAR